MRTALLVMLALIALPDDAFAGKKNKKGKEPEITAQDPYAELKSYEEVTLGKERVGGLFTFHRDKVLGTVYLELKPGQLDKDYLFSAKGDRAVGERGLYANIMMESYIFRFHRHANRVQMVRPNMAFRAAEDAPEARAVAASFTPSIVASVPLAAKPKEDGTLLIDVSKMLLGGDLHQYGKYLGQVYEGSFALDAENSGLTLVKSFPTNSELGVEARFAGQGESGSVALPDARSMQIGFRYSLLELPKDDYVPRLADDRVGYFPETWLDFSTPGGEEPYVRYISRWKLEKKDPNAEVSEPVEPIVYWIENSVPERYRAAIAEGIEMWKPAFEAAGFKDAIVAKVQPDDADWDPADARYNTIRWFVGYDATFAIGPSHTDPRTGQLLDADIGFADGIIRYGGEAAYRYNVDPAKSLQEWTERMLAPIGRDRACTHGADMAEQAAHAIDVLAAQGTWSSEEEERFVHEFVREVTAHEVGHTLGLRHNFIASTIHGHTDLYVEGAPLATVSSVMDYNPPLIAPKGSPQPSYFPSEVGAYDIFAIQYGYTPTGAKTPEEEAETLGKLAARGAERELYYATDEDAGFAGRALDPRVSRFDFGADPIAWYTDEVKRNRELWSSLAEKFEKDGESYEAVRRAFGRTWRGFTSGGMVAAKHVGGVYHQRHHVGDEGGTVPYTPVSADEQRRALKFLEEQIWAKGAFDVPPELMQRLQAARQADLEGSIWFAPRIDFPLHDMVAQTQITPLVMLFDPTRLSRMADLEKMSDDTLSIDELFSTVRKSVWSDMSSGRIESHRRTLQTAHVELLMATAMGQMGAPPDAVALARLELKTLSGQLGSAASRAGDRTTKAHLELMKSLVDKTLDAQLELEF